MTLPVIAITNESTVLTDDQVKAVLPALQKQVTNDFRAFYDIDATLVFVAKGSVLTDGWWQIVVLDDPDQAGALGYHDISSQGTPLGKVFAKLDIENKSSWTVTISHELLEMLGDPDINLCAQADTGVIYAYEVCDPVESDSLGYQIYGVLVSDFVTPKWFQPSAFGSLYSFKNNVSGSFRLAKDGYISIYKNGAWSQVQPQAKLYIDPTMGTPHAALRFYEDKTPIPSGSRRNRREIGAAYWLKSVK